MGAVFVRGIQQGTGQALVPHELHNPLQPLAVVAQANNTALVKRFHSECHAEANAVSACCKLGTSLAGTTCYVTRAPCTDCYRLLVTAGVHRIVCPQCPVSTDCVQSVHDLQIEWIEMRESVESRHTRDVECKAHEDPELVQHLRKERKLARELEKGNNKKRKLERQQMENEKRMQKSKKNKQKSAAERTTQRAGIVATQGTTTTNGTTKDNNTHG